MNYNEIVDASLDYSDRLTDPELINRIDVFLRIVESRVNKVLMVQKMAIRSYLVTQADMEYYTLPNDFNGIRDVEIKDSLDATSRKTLSYLSPEQMNYVSSNSGYFDSIYYTIIANQIQVLPIQPENKILEFVYYRGVLPLSSSNLNNWLSDYYPEVYIFGLLVEISSFTKDAVAKELWDKRFKEASAELEYSDARTRWSGTALQVRVG